MGRLRHFRHDLTGPKARGFDIPDRVKGGLPLLSARVKDCGAITGPSVIALAVQCGWIMNLKKEFEKLAIAELLRVEGDLDCLRVAPVIAIRCVCYVAARIANTRRDNPWIAAYKLLHSPEATAGKNRSFKRHFILGLL